MIRGSDSETSESEAGGSDDQGSAQWSGRPVLRQPVLVMQDDPEVADLTRILEDQLAQRQALQAQQQAQAAQQQQMMEDQAGRQGGSSGLAEAAERREWVKVQAVTSSDLREDVASIERFTGEVGELNHFLRSGDWIDQRIGARQLEGRLDGLDAESLRRALIRRVHRRVLNRIQAEEGTTWAEIKRRLQKEYGGGRWTPDEDALRMLRMTRSSRQSKGEFSAQLLRQYTAVVDKYRETLPGPEATAKVELLECLVKVQLGEALETQVSGSVVEEANRVIDRAGRDGPRDYRPTPSDEWRPPRRREEDTRRYRPTMQRGPARTGQFTGDQRVRRGSGGPTSGKAREALTCYSCGKRGHVQARCASVRCYECGNTGHLARACPYIRQPKRTREEPMEVNLHDARGPREKRPRARDGDRAGSSGSDRSSLGKDTTDSDSEASSYATVVRKGKPGRGRGALEPDRRV